MKDTAPIGMGVIAIAAIFGLIAAGVAAVMFDFWFFGAVFVGLFVAAITAIALMLGWRTPQDGPVGVGHVTQSPAAAVAKTPAPVAAAPVKAAPAAPAPAAEPVKAAPVAKTPASVKEKPAPAPAAVEKPKPIAKAKAPVVADEVLPAEVPGEVATQAPADAGDAAKPEFLSAARAGGPDDLKQIKGVGPKLEKTLHEMGIYHFDQISKWGPKEQAWMDDNLAGFKGRATRDNWVEQATTLAAGGATDFSSKVKKGGVY